MEKQGIIYDYRINSITSKQCFPIRSIEAGAVNIVLLEIKNNYQFIIVTHFCRV